MNAESTTKFLRSKAPIEEIISTANNLLDNQISVYLPNKNNFIFELLCDRVNQGQFKEWKFNKETWKLLIKSWTLLQNEKPLRNRVFNNVRYVELLTNVFSNHDVLLWEKVFEFTNLVMDQTYIEIDETSSLNLLNSYVSNVPVLNDQWTQTIKDILDLQNLKITNTFSKKSYGKFIQESGLNLLNFLLVNPEGVSSRLIEGIFTNTIFIDDYVKYFITNINQLFTANIEALSTSAVSLLFKLTITHVSVKNIKICEELFISIISHEKFATVSEDLLSILSANLLNKSLSSEFVKTIFVNEVDSKADDINWNLVSHLLNLDVERTIEYGPKIFTLLTKEQKLAIPIAESILQAYLKGREIHEFFTIVWINAIKNDKIWASTEFVNAVSKCINSLSSNQLGKLLTEAFKIETEYQIPLLTGILKGLTSSPFAKVDSLKELVLENSAIFLNSDDRFWSIYYYVLCIFEEFAPMLKERIIAAKSIGTEYFSALFRLIELTGESTSLQTKFISHVKKSNADVIEVILNRWLVILENFFEQEQLASFITTVFKKLPIGDIKEYLHNDGELFFEQPKLTAALTKYILKNTNAELIPVIPLQCFDKSNKKELISKLYKLALDTTLKENFQYRESLRHLTKNSQGGLYSDFEGLVKLVETATPESKAISLEMVKSIWTSELGMNIEGDKKFISSSLKHLIKSAKFKYKFTISASLEVALYLLETSNLKKLDDETKESLELLISTLSTSLNQALTKLISKKLVSENISKVDWIFSAIGILFDRLPTTDHDVLLSNMKQVGSQVNELPDGQVKSSLQRHLFALSTKLYSEEHSLYLISLHFILESNGLDLSKELLSYLLKLDQSTFQEVFQFVLQSAEGITTENSAIFVNILCILTRSSKKDHTNSNLFISVLSTLISNVDNLSISSIDQVVTILRLCLTDMLWLFNQYSLESTFTLITKISHKFGKSLHSPELYIKSTQVISNALLFHRYKLSSRHHLVISTFVSLLEPLSLKNESALSKSKDCGVAYSRLLSNLCDSTSMSRELSRNSLNSVASLIKKALRRHLPVLVINYIYLNLKFNFENDIVDEILPGIYSAFDVLSQNELQLVSTSLDLPGKSYYRTLYESYKDNGKWKQV